MRLMTMQDLGDTESFGSVLASAARKADVLRASRSLSRDRGGEAIYREIAEAQKAGSTVDWARSMRRAFERLGSMLLVHTQRAPSADGAPSTAEDLDRPVPLSDLVRELSVLRESGQLQRAEADQILRAALISNGFELDSSVSLGAVRLHGNAAGELEEALRRALGPSGGFVPAKASAQVLALVEESRSGDLGSAAAATGRGASAVLIDAFGPKRRVSKSPCSGGRERKPRARELVEAFFGAFTEGDFGLARSLVGPALRWFGREVTPEDWQSGDLERFAAEGVELVSVRRLNPRSIAKIPTATATRLFEGSLGAWDRVYLIDLQRGGERFTCAAVVSRTVDRALAIDRLFDPDSFAMFVRLMGELDQFAATEGTEDA